MENRTVFYKRFKGLISGKPEKENKNIQRKKMPGKYS
jgi:hypothetical protein